MRTLAVRARFGNLLWLSTVAQSPYVGIALLFLGAQMALGALYPSMDWAAANSMLVVLLSTLIAVAIVLVAYLFVEMAMQERPRHPAVQLLRKIWAVISNARTMALGLPFFVSLIVLTFAFINIKGNIPVFQPFAWDRTFDHWDLVLHFGRRPWEWLHPLLGYWPITFLINLLYGLWFAVMIAVWLHYAFMSAPGVARTRFLLAFMLVWMMGGGLLAVVFSSAGPCFYGAGHLGFSPDPYAELMAYLRRADGVVPIWAVNVQQQLWQLHLEGTAEASISAMPSMHNASALLFALASSGWPVWIKRLLWIYVGVIFLGSVHLGYHYAVDAYAGWALALVIWWLAGELARRWEETAPAVRFRNAFADSPGFALTAEGSGLEHSQKNRRVPGCPPTRPTSTRTKPTTSR